MDLMISSEQGAEGGRRGSCLSASRKLSVESQMGVVDGSVDMISPKGRLTPDRESRESAQRPMRRSSLSSRSPQNLEGGGDADWKGPQAGTRFCSLDRNASKKLPPLYSIASADPRGDALEDGELSGRRQSCTNNN